MAKKIVITHDGKDYTLEFNRKSVKQMEASGFVVNTDKPMTMVLDLFHGAFAMHHRNIQRDKTEAIWDEQRGKDKLLSELISMYTEPLSELMNEKEGDGEDENPTWKVL